jgi:hypothetical protein
MLGAMFLATTLLLAAAPVPRSLSDAADDANMQLTRCLFQQASAARSAGLSPEEFGRRLSGQCLQEERAWAAAARRIARLRGLSPGYMDRVIADARRSVVDSYRQEPAFEEQIRAACTAEPEACTR